MIQLGEQKQKSVRAYKQKAGGRLGGYQGPWREERGMEEGTHMSQFRLRPGYVAKRVRRIGLQKPRRALSENSF